MATLPRGVTDIDERLSARFRPAEYLPSQATDQEKMLSQADVAEISRDSIAKRDREWEQSQEKLADTLKFERQQVPLRPLTAIDDSRSTKSLVQEFSAISVELGKVCTNIADSILGYYDLNHTKTTSDVELGRLPYDYMCRRRWSGPRPLNIVRPHPLRARVYEQVVRSLDKFHLSMPLRENVLAEELHRRIRYTGIYFQGSAYRLWSFLMLECSSAAWFRSSPHEALRYTRNDGGHLCREQCAIMGAPICQDDCRHRQVADSCVRAEPDIRRVSGRLGKIGEQFYMWCHNTRGTFTVCDFHPMAIVTVDGYNPTSMMVDA